jgi:uroporphyrinogen decarboxylase
MRVPVKDKLITGADGTIHWDSVAGNLECPPGSYFFDYPVKAGTMDDMDDYDYPSPDDINPSHDINDEKLRRLEDAAKRMFNETELSLCMGETLPDLQYLPGGMIRGMMFLAEYPEQMKEILKKFVDAALSQLHLLEQAVGKYVDILLIAHDLGDNRGVTIGPDMFREIYKPFYKELFGGWKKISSMKINLHACGAISDILDDLIECGLDIYNPVQISGNNMDPAMLKSRFGSRLIFWGGAYDTHLNQPGDSYDEVYQRTYKNIKAFGKNGGYIMSGVHNLPPEIPEHHLKAILDAWKDARQYS